MVWFNINTVPTNSQIIRSIVKLSEEATLISKKKSKSTKKTCKNENHFDHCSLRSRTSGRNCMQKLRGYFSRNVIFFVSLNDFQCAFAAPADPEAVPSVDAIKVVDDVPEVVPDVVDTLAVPLADATKAVEEAFKSAIVAETVDAEVEAKVDAAAEEEKYAVTELMDMLAAEVSTITPEILEKLVEPENKVAQSANGVIDAMPVSSAN